MVKHTVYIFEYRKVSPTILLPTPVLGVGDFINELQQYSTLTVPKLDVAHETLRLHLNVLNLQ